MSLAPLASSDVVNYGPQTLVTSTWTNNTNDLNISVTFTSSLQGGNPGMLSPTSSGMFYIDVYNAVTSSTTSEVQFSLD